MTEMSSAREGVPSLPAEPSRRNIDLAREAGRCLLGCGALRPWFARAGRRVQRCPSCGLVVVPEGLAVDESGVSIYESETSVFEADGNEGYYFDETNFANCRLKLAWVARDLPRGSRLLDAGANFGHFLKVAQERYDATGIDLSPTAVRWSRERLGVRNHVGSVYDVTEPAGSYDAVTLWDVIEHLEDPLRALQRLRELLRPGGFLFLSTPDSGSPVARLLGRQWHYLDPLQHITVFSRRNLQEALEAAGFRIVRTGSLGHHYRLRYVIDRLAYLHRGHPLGALFAGTRRILGPILGLSVYLNPGDVVAITARQDGGTW